LIFFFQAEDGIRDFHVTGVQTCALPIYIGKQRIEGAVGAEIGAGDRQRAAAVVQRALLDIESERTISVRQAAGENRATVDVEGVRTCPERDVAGNRAKLQVERIGAAAE